MTILPAGPAPVPGDGTEDLALLRSFEPVVRYTEGELFFPTCVRAYVAQCSLWAGGGADDRGDVEALLVPAGTLTLDKLCDAARTARGRPLTLRFVQASMDRAAYRRWRRGDRPRLRAEGPGTGASGFDDIVLGPSTDTGKRKRHNALGISLALLPAEIPLPAREYAEQGKFADCSHPERAW